MVKKRNNLSLIVLSIITILFLSILLQSFKIDDFTSISDNLNTITGKSVSIVSKLLSSRVTKNIPPKITNPSIVKSGILSREKYSAEKRSVSKISNPSIKKNLNEALNYKLKPNERFDKKGDIIVKLQSGREVVKLGYQAQKEFLIQTNTKKEWPELKLIKRDIPKKYKQLVRKKSPKPSLITTRGVDDLNEDDLNQLNSLFHKEDYSLDGLMYYAADLYNNGVFPFLPYLTPVKDQGYRGTCGNFAAISAIELISRDKPDLSEQNMRYGISWPGRSLYDLNLSLRSDNLGLEIEWPYNPMPCIPLEDDWQLHGGRGSHINSGGAGSYYSELLDEDIPCSDTDGEGIIVGGHFEPYPPVMVSDSGRCFIVRTDYFMEWNLEDPENATKYMALLINDLKYPIVISPGWIEIDDVVDGFITEDVVDYSSSHVVSVIGFIPNDEIPDRVQAHPSFVPGDNYFIVKNSLGTETGDSGFLYFPESVLMARIPTQNNNWRGGISGVFIYKYDGNSERFDNCPFRRFNGVVP